MTIDINKVRIEINTNITAGMGVMLKWKNNSIYKFHEHHRHLDGEEALAILMVEGVTITQFLKILDPTSTSVVRDSNRDKGAKVVYVSGKLPVK